MYWGLPSGVLAVPRHPHVIPIVRRIGFPRSGSSQTPSWAGGRSPASPVLGPWGRRFSRRRPRKALALI
eukprot:g11260.t2